MLTLIQAQTLGRLEERVSRAELALETATRLFCHLDAGCSRIAGCIAFLKAEKANLTEYKAVIGLP